MLKRWMRVLRNRDGSTDDVSLSLQNSTGVIHDFGATTEALYVGQYFPFNSLYVEMNTASIFQGTLNVATWDGNSWVDSVDVLDSTVSLTQSGLLQWEPDRNSGWVRVSETEDETGSGLEDFKIYDLYWARIRCSDGLSADTKIKSFRYMFCQSADLLVVDPEVNDYLTSWTSGKTSWDDQIAHASQLIVEDLQSRNFILHGGQILRFDDVHTACIYRTLMVIYANLGTRFQEKMGHWAHEYNAAIRKRFTLDRNKDGRVEVGEIGSTVIEGIR